MDTKTSKVMDRRMLLIGFGIAALLVLMASTAFACTVFKGELKASGNGTGNIEDIVHGDNAGMAWCDAARNDDPDGDPDLWTVRIQRSAQVTLQTKPTTQCGGGSQLRDGALYRVGHQSGFMPAGGGTASTHNCHGSNALQIDTGSVLDGVWTSHNSPTNTLSFTATKTGWHSICILDANSVDAIAINVLRV